MNNKPLTKVQSSTLHFSGANRATNALRGIVPATVAMPLVLSVWSPTWFVVTWTATYIAISAFFIYLSFFHHSERVEQSWSISVAVLFCLVPVSTNIWSDQPEHFWAAATITMMFIAFELSTLPFLRIGEWRIGVLLVGLTTTVCGILTINPIVALAFAPVVLSMIVAADRIRGLKIELEQHLDVAQQAIRHDPLTGLLNRRGLATRIEQLSGQDITVALIDVDRFKIVNDTHGHQIGDQVLVSLGEQLRTRLGAGFELARLGGDEFVAVAPGLVAVGDHVAELANVTTKIHQQAVDIDCTFSVGVSHGPNIESAHRLLSEAGFAMRESKRSGAAVSRFGDELSQQLDRTVQVAAMANGAGNSGTFFAVAQAIVDEQNIVGCELLIRWRLPDGELLLPNQFLTMASEAGLMPVINEMMLKQAVQFAARFNGQPNAPFASVNIAASHLGESSFCQRVEDLLVEHNVPADRLMIEITETEQLSGYGTWEAAAAELRMLGVNLAMDDFGTGYSSMDRLQHLPISHLKFDRSIVQTASTPFGEIVRGVARFATAANIGIIAEGIETHQEFETMRSFDISTFQGFLFHRPEALDQLAVKIRAGKLAEVSTRQ